MWYWYVDPKAGEAVVIGKVRSGALADRIEAQGIVINEIYANFLRESSSCNTYLSIDLEHENGSEAQIAPSFYVFEQESEAETIKDETQVPPPAQSGFEYDEPEFPCPRVLTNEGLESSKCSTTSSIGYEYDTHVPLFAYSTLHDSLYPLCTLHLSCEDDMMQGSQREEHREDKLMDEIEMLVSIHVMEGKGEWFDPVGDLDELEALLYGKPTLVTKEEPHGEKDVQTDGFTNEPMTMVTPDPPLCNKESWPVIDHDVDSSHESNKPRIIGHELNMSCAHMVCVSEFIGSHETHMARVPEVLGPHGHVSGPHGHVDHSSWLILGHMGRHEHVWPMFPGHKGRHEHV
ncbi:hypothetical protein L1987_02062 [Smallanthus sonchifolius]|uniref:Uncharacterized protein n=1 Tax=Smallanthus sonchifolius TaxID=185202 RepID=A0ACB9K6T1_9ASTR|nr:hypothetical protein L1987_02062 [Smallanthus sonchifolius]